VALAAAQHVTDPNRVPLLEIYNDIKIDGRLMAVSQKRRVGVFSAMVTWQGLESEQHIENLQLPWFYKMIDQLMNRVFIGYGVIELKLEGGLITETYDIPRQHILPERRAIRLKKDDLEDAWINYMEAPYCNFLLEVGCPDDFGLYAVAAQSVLPLRDAIADFALANELFAMPTRVYFYDPNIPGNREQVEQLAKALTTASYAVMPYNTEVKQLNTPAEAIAEAYSGLIDIYLDDITILILGQPSTTSNPGKGGGGIGEIHLQQERAINLEDRQFVLDFLNGPFREAAVKHGYPLENATAKYNETHLLGPLERAKIWTMAHKWDVPISPKAWRLEYDIPEPKPGEATT